MVYAPGVCDQHYCASQFRFDMAEIYLQSYNYTFATGYYLFSMLISNFIVSVFMGAQYYNICMVDHELIKEPADRTKRRLEGMAVTPTRQS